MSHVEHLKQLHDLELYQDLKQFVSYSNCSNDLKWDTHIISNICMMVPSKFGVVYNV